jgi:hypothetical protein
MLCDTLRTRRGFAQKSLSDSRIGGRLHTLAMPAGEYLHYNALTVDRYPSWTALG